MIGLGLVYTVAGLVFLTFAWFAARDRRLGNGAFHLLIAASFLLGDRLGDTGNGVLVLALAAVGGTGLMRRGDQPPSPERPRGDALFAAALIVPAVTVVGTLLFKQVPALVDPKQATLVALTAGVLVALAVSLWRLRAPLATPWREGARLMDGIGWAAILPQLLASLGAVFAAAKVGDIVGGAIGHAIPPGSLVGAVLAYTLGMALFTMALGNAFAAFPVMIAAVGLPLLVRVHGGDPAPVAAIGMLAGFCGTLLTPMAANYNLVPVALLDLPDRYAVIRAQAPTALAMLAFNTALLYLVLR